MRQRTSKAPRCIVIAGPNGAGKTTFAREYLPREGRVICFVNADLIASGLSPLRPELAARRAGRLVLAELSRLAKERKHFAFERTLTHIIHERFYCNRRYAAATSLAASFRSQAGGVAPRGLDILFQVCLGLWGLRAPVSTGVLAISSRTIMNNVGLSGRTYLRLLSR